MNEPSDRMQDLVSDFGADCINYGCNQLRPMVNYPLIENVDCKAKEAALLTAIAELEQRAEKWQRLAVAQERVRQMQYSSDAETLRRFAEKDAAIAALGDEWTEAVK